METVSDEASPFRKERRDPELESWAVACPELEKRGQAIVVGACFWKNEIGDLDSRRRAKLRGSLLDGVDSASKRRRVRKSQQTRGETLRQTIEAFDRECGAKACQ